MVMICLHTKFHMPSSSGSSVIVIHTSYSLYIALQSTENLP